MNNIIKLLLAFLVGVLGGSSAVYTGIGVSLMVPLVLYLDVIKDYKTAVGTMFLAVYSPISTIPAYNYYKSGNLDVKIGLWLGLGYFVGGFVTSTYFLDSIKREILYLIFGIYSLIVGYIFVKKSKLIF
jgi:uncharacterized membrane protein YfcA